MAGLQERNNRKEGNGIAEHLAKSHTYYGHVMIGLILFPSVILLLAISYWINRPASWVVIVKKTLNSVNTYELEVHTKRHFTMQEVKKLVEEIHGVHVLHLYRQ